MSKPVLNLKRKCLYLSSEQNTYPLIQYIFQTEHHQIKIYSQFLKDDFKFASVPTFDNTCSTTNVSQRISYLGVHNTILALYRETKQY